MADNARSIHVSPGIYSKETVLEYAVKSLGITTLGCVGETLRGPAFQPMMIENWRDFQSMFGGTSTEKFAGSQYPKYELPYIAKSYLSESNQLQVCRVLGLSGYNAGPAWVVTAKYNDHENGIENKEMVVCVLRSRGYFEKYRKFTSTTGSCECPTDSYDSLVYRVGELDPTKIQNICDAPKMYNMKAVQLDCYTPLVSYGSECEDYANEGECDSFEVSSTNYGRFSILCIDGLSEYGEEAKSLGYDDARYKKYPVSLNPNDKDYILKVLGTDPQNGETPLYVEALYDVALEQGIESDYIHELNEDLTEYQVFNKADFCGLRAVDDIISMQEEILRRKDVGKRYLANQDAVESNIHCHPYNFKTGKPLTWNDVLEVEETANKDADGKVTSYTYSYKVKEEYKNYIKTDYLTETNDRSDFSKLAMQNVEVGRIYTVVQHTDPSGKRHYYYRYYPMVSLDDNKNLIDGLVETKFVKIPTLIDRQDKLLDMASAASTSGLVTGTSTYPSGLTFAKYLNDGSIDKGRMTYLSVLVKNNADGNYYRLHEGDIDYIKCEMNDYKEAYRFASTPWIVSNVKGDFGKIELNKLFRFHTISDGNSSNNEIKISIQNIRPDAGTFDVFVRDINDKDESIVVLEKFTKCTLIPTDDDYIAYKIGSYDGMYESKSKYITVEVNESIATKNSSPAGFMGYPLSMFSGLTTIDLDDASHVIPPVIKYNLNFDENVKNRRQYFGLSSWIGTDVDMFNYKGKAAYNEYNPDFLSNGFHLDARMDMNGYPQSERPVITVDGEYGYKFDAVSNNNRTAILEGMPVIDKESEMKGSIYEHVDLRKFTVYFYGGFDGWDVYRNYRSNTDDFKLSNYNGDYNDFSGEGFSFNKIENPESIGLNQNGITSDFYAYLAAYRQFANPESVDINVFATPGIDLINNKILAQEVIDMIEEERADSIYVATMPDKPFGAADYVDEMYSPEDLVIELEDTEIDSNYTCTYYPWIKYEDVENSQYIYLPPTKDVVRNMALTDNTTQPWYAVAGTSRGNVNCVRAHYVTKLADEDVLYEGRINPIKTFAQEGVKIWGQKNLQIKDNQLNRIAVRRLLLRMRKLISIACLGLIFEPNDATTKNKFLSTVTPIMDNIKANRGISDYRIEVNDTIESRERRELPAKIYFKPLNALEYIDLEFILTPEGVNFDDI